MRILSGWNLSAKDQHVTIGHLMSSNPDVSMPHGLAHMGKYSKHQCSNQENQANGDTTFKTFASSLGPLLVSRAKTNTTDYYLIYATLHYFCGMMPDKLSGLSA
jgi:hypothetical protein